MLLTTILTLTSLSVVFAGATVSYKRDTNWESGETKFAQFTIPIKTDTEITDWSADIEFNDTVELVQIWNGTATISGNKMSVTPASYNKLIQKDSSIDFGFIVSAKNEPKITNVKFTDNKGKSSSAKGTTVEGKPETNFFRNIFSSFQKAYQFVISSATKSSTITATTSTPSTTQGGTPLEEHGELRVQGTNIVDKNNNPYILKGVSTHGIAWFPEYVNKESFQTIRDLFGANTIRLALYSSDNEGYNTTLHTKVDEGVKYATELGMYVIIDWHILQNGNPNTDKERAKAFFIEMSNKYKNNDNVIYEICNEPNGDVQWQRDIKPYATELINTIRGYDDDAIIIVGTPTWSQDVDIVAQDPITGYGNITYALHYYAATHTDNLRQKLQTAIDKGLPVIVSEFGICDASGNGNVNEAEANKWLDMLNKNNIGYVCWNLSNKNEASSIIKSSCTKTSGWTEEDLSQEGKWLVKAYNK